MVKTEYPGKQEISGIFLLGPDDLRELDSLVDKFGKLISQHVNKTLLKKAKALHEDWTAEGRSLSLDEAKKRVSDRYPFSKKRASIFTAECSTGKSVKGSSFDALLKSNETHGLQPQQLTVEIEHADVDLEIELNAKWWNDSLGITIRPSDLAFSHRIIEQFTDWALKKRQFGKLHAIRNSFLGFLGFFLLILTTFFWFGGAGALAFRSEPSGRAELVQRAHAIAENGITPAEQPIATEILLRLETGDYAPSKVVGFNWWYLPVLLCLIACCLLALNLPRTTIGIGKATRWLWVYQQMGRSYKWIIGIVVALPAAILIAALKDTFLRFIHGIWQTP